MDTISKSNAGRKRSEVRTRLIEKFLDEPSISPSQAAKDTGASVTLAYELKRAVEDVTEALDRRRWESSSIAV